MTLSNNTQLDLQIGYLHNVVPQEIAAGSPVASYIAQVIVSRTYGYFQTNGGSTAINNSAARQVYIPYRYQALRESSLSWAADRLDDAITLPGPLYITLPGNDEPIDARFGKDNCSVTEDGGESYLQPIYDPISVKASETDNDPATICRNQAHGTVFGGLGSAGASRWGYGNTDEYNHGEAWSVRWEEAYQILTHYYTGIVIRNAAGQILTPAYRWNPLILGWGGGAVAPPPMWYGGDNTHRVAVTLQNTGHFPWTHTGQGGSARWYLAYRWTKDDNIQEGQRIEIVETDQPLTVLPGQHRTVTLSVADPPDWGPGEYILDLDLLYEVQSTGNIIWFSDGQSSAWFVQSIRIPATICIQSDCAGPPNSSAYLPLLAKALPLPPEPTPTPPPITSCVWESNRLRNSAFTLGPDPLDHWQVGVDTSHTGRFSRTDLYDSRSYYSPDSGAAGAFLGGENDAHQPEGGDQADQYIAQTVLIEETETVAAIRLAFSYCLTTFEQTSLNKDAFFVDLQAGAMGTGSVFPNALTYTNQTAFSALDPANCRHDSGQWRRRSRVAAGVGQHYQGDRLFSLVFYSDVDEGRPSTFYSEDANNNLEQPHTAHFDIDLTPPTVAHTLTGRQTASNWYTPPVTLTLTGQDNLSGIAYHEINLNRSGWLTMTTSYLITPTGAHTVSYRAVDWAGHRSETGLVNLYISRSPPQPLYFPLIFKLSASL